MMNNPTKSLAEINRVLETENFYKLLDVPNNATDQEIKSANRRISLIVHPDKNENAAGAKEAFIAVQNATAVLLDKDKRIEYDDYLRSPMSFWGDKFNLSEDAIYAILLTSGMVAGLLGIKALFGSLLGSKKKNHE